MDDETKPLTEGVEKDPFKTIQGGDVEEIGGNPPPKERIIPASSERNQEYDENPSSLYSEEYPGSYMQDNYEGCEEGI